jgi:hemerythrin-like domain-containing protein
MLPLTKVTHEHHDLMWRYVNQLNELADCLNGDCLDNARLVSQLPQLREVHEGLVHSLIPHMETVEVAVYPTLDRLLATRGITVPMATEHREIRRLVASLGRRIGADAVLEVDRSSVLALRRIMLRLYALLKTHLSEEELYLPVLEGRLTSVEEAALARALDHLAAERL